MQQPFEQAKENMVKNQILPNKVTDPAVIEALRTIPREKFVPSHLSALAYVDEDVAVGQGRYLPEPVVIARLLQCAAIQKNDVVLNIGCGTGYTAAVLGQLAATVIGTEQSQSMAQDAEKTLRSLDICNSVVVSQKDLRDGYSQQGPYNVIYINGSVPAVPDNIKAQLADGGRLVAVLSGKGHMGTAVLIRRNGNTFTQHPLFDAATPTLTGFEGPKTFSL